LNKFYIQHSAFYRRLLQDQSCTKCIQCPYDNKRYITPESINSLPWRYYRIPL